MQDAYRAFSLLASCERAALCEEVVGSLLHKVAKTRPAPKFLAFIFGSGSRGMSSAVQVRAHQLTVLCS